MPRAWWATTLFCLRWLAAAVGMGAATPTGLNNIPTGEVVDAGVLVVQGFSQFGEGSEPAWFAGVKYGPARNWEVGLDDSVLGPGSVGGPVLQVKRRIAAGPAVEFALGAANVSNDRSRHGDVLPYAVASGTIVGGLRAHLGRSWQAGNQAWFGGLSEAVSPKLTLRGDWIQAEEGHESVASVGFIGELGPRWLGEAWASFPSASGQETTWVVKLDWVVPLAGRG
jgi:hypothetical protein